MEDENLTTIPYHNVILEEKDGTILKVENVYEDQFAIGDKSWHEGSDSDEPAVITGFRWSKQYPDEIIADTTQGWAHIDFLISEATKERGSVPKPLNMGEVLNDISQSRATRRTAEK